MVHPSYRETLPFPRYPGGRRPRWPGKALGDGACSRKGRQGEGQLAPTWRERRSVITIRRDITLAIIHTVVFSRAFALPLLLLLPLKETHGELNSIALKVAMNFRFVECVDSHIDGSETGEAVPISLAERTS